MIDTAAQKLSIDRTQKLKNEVARWLEILKKDYHPEKIILFGSYVNGKINEWSDVDMVVVKDTDKRFLDRSKELLLLLTPSVGLDVLVYTPAEFEKLAETRNFVKHEIISKGLIAYEK